jgi:pilus assembly protein CpaC
MRQGLNLVMLVFLLLAASTLLAQNPSVPAAGSTATNSSNTGSEDTQVPLPSTGGEETLRVFLGKSLVVMSADSLKRASVTDPMVASAVIVSPNQIMIHGLKAGAVTLLLWDQQEQLRSFDLQVQLDTGSILTSMKQHFPKENIGVSQSGAALVLTGDVSSQAVADKALALAQTGAPTVVNLMRPKLQTNDTVMLQVRFAEVDRTAVQQLGMNIISTGAANTAGGISTQQFGALSANVGSVPANVQRGKDPEATNLLAGAIGQTTQNTPSVFGLSDLLNIFVFRPDLNLGTVIKAMQQRNLLQILAEPNLMAINGQEASFLAGGEFPFPVVQGGGTGLNAAITIIFKEFGVRLKFVATMLDEGAIRLKVAPEVSALDFSNALTVSGFTVPALTTRRIDTQVDLRDGQSFAIAGLIDNRLTETASKIPWLGDVPIVGKFFHSRATNRNKTELMVLVTPTIVKPLEPGQVASGPQFPKAFWDEKKFDGKSIEAQAPSSQGTKNTK